MLFPYDTELIEEYKVVEEKKHREAEWLAKLEAFKANARERYHIVTAYSSTFFETDSTPFITARGTHVRDGIVAANTLPFGTKILIPALFGNKVFTVEDRMAPKNHHKIDIWFPSTGEAKEFGIKKAKILVLPPEYERSESRAPRRLHDYEPYVVHSAPKGESATITENPEV